MYTHLWSVGGLEAVGGGAGVPAVVLGGDAAEAEGGAALVEGGVALLVPLHLEGPRVRPDHALDLDQPLPLLDLAAVRQRDDGLVQHLQGQLGLPNLEGEIYQILPSVTMFTICDQISPSVALYRGTILDGYNPLLT